MLQMDFLMDNCEPRLILIWKVDLIFHWMSIGTHLGEEYLRGKYI